MQGLAGVLILFTIRLAAIAFIIAAITIMGFFFFIEYKSHIEYFWLLRGFDQLN
jgi:hypothetical protein